jgi:hypothetical protein
MKTIRAVVVSILLTAVSVVGQQMPHLAYVYPAGGRVGSTFDVVIGGQFLLTTSNAFFTGEGIQAIVKECTRPMNQKEFNELRDRLKVLQDKFQATRKGNNGTNVWTGADGKEMAEIRDKILKNPPNRAANPAMIDTLTVKVTVATNAWLGEHEVRLASRGALSNPLKFLVGNLPEFSKPPAKPANPDLDRYLERLGRKTNAPGTPKYEARILLPATINGQMMPGGVDRLRFNATSGQHLVLKASARSLIPYLADAVPGWFEATITIHDSKGHELATAERFRFRPDPVLEFEVPQSGEYTVEIHDSIYRGREDFVYRLTIGELPFVTGIFPLGGKQGQGTRVALTGWNLTNQSVVQSNIVVSPGISSLGGDWLNGTPFAVDNLAECQEQEPNQSVATAQPLTLPVIVNGRIGRAGESDVFKFEGRAGQQIVAEVMARRLDSPLDSCLRLTDGSGQQIAFNDDFEDKGCGLETHHADSYIRTTLHSDGAYFLHLTDAQGQGGPEFAYRLRVSEPRPDFALRLVPSSLTVRAGMSVPITAHVLRKDGFTNAIELRLVDSPRGFTLSGARVPENQDKVQFTLKASAQSAVERTHLDVAGTAIIAGQSLIHSAVPAEDMMQAFAYRHLVPARELAVLVVENPRPFASDAIKVVSATPVKISCGGTARILVSTPSAAFAERFKLELRGAPDGISLQDVTPSGNGIALLVAADSSKIRAGTNGNLILDVMPRNSDSNPNPKKGAAAARRAAVGTLPAIPFSVVAE